MPELPRKPKDSILKRAYMSLASSFSSVASPTVLFQINLHALAFLSRTSDLDTKAFWEQVTRVCHNYMANYVGGEEGEGETRRVILDGLKRITSEVENRQESESDSLMSGDSWLGFCEFWLSLAKRVWRKSCGHERY